MSNIFMEDRSHHIFKWEKLGNIKEGRSDLGEEMSCSARPASWQAQNLQKICWT